MQSRTATNSRTPLEPEHRERAVRTRARYRPPTPRTTYRVPIVVPVRARTVPVPLARKRAEHRDLTALHIVNQKARVQPRHPLPAVGARRVGRNIGAGAAALSKRVVDAMDTYTEGESGIVMGSGGGMVGETFKSGGGGGIMNGEVSSFGSKVVVDGDNVASVAGHYGMPPLEGVLRAARYYREHPKSPFAGVLISSGLAARAHKQSGRALKQLVELMQMGGVSVIPHGADYHNFVIKVALTHSADLVSNHDFAFQRAQQLPPDSNVVYRLLECKRVPFGFFQGIFIPNPHPKHIHFGLHAARS